MTDLVAAAQIIAGTGAAGWLADKLLGPSFEGLGDQFKAYAGARIDKIFGRAADRLNKADVHGLPPGFAVSFLQKASFSEDDETLTELWANLLASAATGFESRQAAYVEILSQMTARDARYLEEIVPVGSEARFESVRPVNEQIENKVRLAKQIINISLDRDAGLNEINRLYNLDLGWPGRVNSARVYFVEGDNNLPLSGGRPIDTSSQDNLVRLGILERFEISNSLTPLDVGFQGVLLTSLGLEFLQSCRSKAK